MERLPDVGGHYRRVGKRNHENELSGSISWFWLFVLKRLRKLFNSLYLSALISKMGEMKSIEQKELVGKLNETI